MAVGANDNNTGRNAVILGSDEKLFPAAAFAAERLAALNPRDDTDIILFTDSVRELEAAAALTLPYQVRPIVRPSEGRVVDPVYLRYFLPEALRGEYRRLLYIDVDTWVENDRPFALFDLAMGGHPLAGVRDACVAYLRDAQEMASVRAETYGNKYLNSGVLMIDTERFVAADIFAKLIALVADTRTPLLHRDQSALNLMFKGDWLELSPGYNMMPPTWRSDIRRVFDPVIVHFAGALKPWHGPRFIIDHPARAAMERYFPTSRWKGFLTQYFSLRDALAAAQSQPAPPQRDFHFGMEFPSRPIFLDYLRNTPFADVEAGLTTPHLDLLPLR